MNVHAAILDLLSRGYWYAPFEVDIHLKLIPVHCAAEAITARIRDLRKPQYGNHKVPKQRRAGTTYFEYRVITPAEMTKAA